MNNVLNPLLVRDPATAPADFEDQDPPGARVWTDTQSMPEAEHQEVDHEMLLHFLDIHDADEADRDSAITENPPIRNLTPELESSTAVVPPSDVEVDFNSEDDAALLECVQLDREADDLLNKMGEGAPPIYVTSSMLSFIVNFPLADRLNKIKLSTKKLFTLSDTILSEDIDWGDETFGNPWLQEPQCRRGILVNLGLDPAHCTCDFCQSYCNPINLRPKGRGKIRVVQKVPGQTQPGILGLELPLHWWLSKLCLAAKTKALGWLP